MASYAGPTDGMYEDLRTLHQHVRIAWLEAQAFPGRSSEILEGLVKQVDHTSRIAAIHLREAVERAKERGNAYDRAKEAAEKRIATALARSQSENIGEQFHPHGNFVYLLWGTDEGCPLYVGKSSNVLARLGAHLGNTRKCSSIRRVTLIRCKGPHHMDQTERRLIQHYLPPWNIALKPVQSLGGAGA